MADFSQRAFPCPSGCRTSQPDGQRIYLGYSFAYKEKEIWWCTKCKEHFVREGDEFYRLLKI